eukprot:CAMPEP_0178976362 /NCGR_PEP_ID=MMETSP0789-20121207/23785_1 /TAXON_ID=3005 /ORGANISM="Rhizosolenia setigera, Strain CCMP 1694" /LENGTH=880 /DNA_ID=CAMNT_0020665429 /DNA_START=15 /DNA_END=2657 /DNA_ORIENTATION=+
MTKEEEEAAPAPAPTEESGGGEKKKLSKKELKKLAKKAEKAALKKKASSEAAAGGNKNQNKNAGNKKKESTATTTTASSFKYEFVLSNFQPNDLSTRKIAVAASLYDIELTCGDKKKSNSTESSMYHGPCLSLKSSNDNNAVIAFGCNAILKALASFSTNFGFNSMTEIDEWLEFERTELRTSSKVSKASLMKLEEGLKKQNGYFLIQSKLTIADISILVTLNSLKKSDIEESPTIQTYLKHHNQSNLFSQIDDKFPSLLELPPPPFSYTTDPSMCKAVLSVFLNAILQVFPSISISQDLPPLHKIVTTCTNAKHGDYQCSVAMPLFAKLKKSGLLSSEFKSPQMVAKAIVEAVENVQSAQSNNDKHQVIEKLQVNGPGFITCKLSSDYLQIHMNRLLQNNQSPFAPTSTTASKVVVDFSSPNIAKEMHVGHLRSTIIGESVCRVLEYCGNDVERVNHVGDWGTQFGMLIQYMKEEQLDNKEGEGNQGSISDLTVFYKEAKKRFDESPEFKKTSQINVVKLQSGDEECMKIWQMLCDISRKEFQKVYDRLNVKVYECGESFYNDKIPSVIEEFEEANLISVEEGGAKCVFIPKDKVPLMLQKSDGGYGYDSTDMAAIKHRVFTLGAKRVVVITDFSQADHFKKCYAAANMIGWIDDQKLEHIGFGTVMGEDGKRFKTRSGDTVRLVDLLDEAYLRMKASLEERLKEGKVMITAEEIPSVAAILGYSAIKYFDLRRNPTTNYRFSYDEMLDTKGNTAIYLLYAHARLESIIQKGKDQYNVDVDQLISSSKSLIQLQHASETNLAYHLHQFTDVVENTLVDLFPYHICDLLYSIANATSEFVTNCRVLGSDEMESRLLLCRATAIIMRQCFDLLGLQYVMRI